MTTTLARWMPADLFRERFDRMLNQSFNEFLAPLGATEDVTNRRWMPAVDIRESDEALTLIAELPGLTKNDVHITMENNVLTLSGERKFETEEKEESYHRIERAYGSFSRSFTLPANVKTDKVEALFKDGLLSVTLPKVEEAKPRKIEIR